MRNFWICCILFLVVIFCFWFQINVLNVIPLFGVVPNIGIVLIVALGILCGQKTGIIVGTLYGIIMDILMGKAFGIYTLLFFLIGFFCGRISYGFSKENKSSIMMIVAVTTVIYEALCLMMFVIVYKYDLSLFSSILTIALECLYNVFIALVFFKPLSFLSEIINKGKKSYYLL